MIRFRKFAASLALLLLGTELWAVGKVTHVVVVVWDGMRPDFVSEQTTPNLWKLARAGVTFQNHHSAYITSTEVNGAVLATGVYPEQNGIVGNNEFRPAIAPESAVMTAALGTIQKGDELSANGFLRAPTLAETLHGRGLGTAVAGAKTVALLQDRRAPANSHLGVDVFEGNALPASVAAQLEKALGKFPATGSPNQGRDRWTTEALTGPLWENGVPAFSLLWLSEPDSSQHLTGPGSKTALEAIKSSDDNLGRVLAALEKKALRRQTDVIVVSDHGFSTIARKADVAAVLNESGFPAVRKFPAPAAHEGKILVVGNGGTAFLYLPNHDPGLTEKVVHCLQAQPFCGVVFARTPVAGAFTLEQARINSPEAPDIAVSLRWSRDKSANGTPGLIDSDGGSQGPGQGMHASLSPFDLHNTCIAAGPDFRQGALDSLPTGNIDIAPTVLWVLGVQPREKMSGRVLSEALAAADANHPTVEPHHLEASFEAKQFIWRQYLNYSEVEGVIYLEEGNGAQSHQNIAAGASRYSR